MLSEISGVDQPKIKIPFPIAFAGAFAVNILSKLRGKQPAATPKKVISLYYKYAYCDSNKAIEALRLRHVPLRETLTKTAGWFKNNGYINAR